MMARQVTSSSLGTSAQTYLYQIAKHVDSYSVIASDDSLRVFDPITLSLLRSIRACSAGVTCLSSDQNTAFVAGRDGCVRAWDVRSDNQSTLIARHDKAGLSAIVSKANFVAAGTESTKEGLGDVDVLVYDVRKPGSPVRTFVDSHTDTITDLAWHPSQPGLLMSGSTDGLVSIFDVEQSDEDDALKQVLNPKSAVHCTGFLADDQAYVLSTDERFFIYGLDKTGNDDEEALPFKDFGDLRPVIDCSYIINLSMPSFSSSPVLIHGNLEKKSLGLTLLDGNDYGVGKYISLQGGHGEEVARDVRFASERTVLSCGEDGHVRVWDLQAAMASGDETIDVGTDAKLVKKKSKKSRKDKSHFAPY